jgi:hypothetical protein
MNAKVSNPLFCSAKSELNAKELTIGAGILVRASAEYPLKLGVLPPEQKNASIRLDPLAPSFDSF